MSEYEKGFNEAMSKVDDHIDDLFFRLKNMMQDQLTDWPNNEIKCGMLSLSILKRELREIYMRTNAE